MGTNTHTPHLIPKMWFLWGYLPPKSPVCVFVHKRKIKLMHVDLPVASLPMLLHCLWEGGAPDEGLRHFVQVTLVIKDKVESLTQNSHNDTGRHGRMIPTYSFHSSIRGRHFAGRAFGKICICTRVNWMFDHSNTSLSNSWVNYRKIFPQIQSERLKGKVHLPVYK